MTAILIEFWNSVRLRTLLIEYLVIAVYGFMYTFFWLLPRRREIFLIPFDEFVERRRLAPRSSFMTPRGLLSAGLGVAGIGLVFGGFFFGFALALRGGDPRTTYSFVGAGLVFDFVEPVLDDVADADNAAQAAVPDYREMADAAVRHFGHQLVDGIISLVRRYRPDEDASPPLGSSVP